MPDTVDISALEAKTPVGVDDGTKVAGKPAPPGAIARVKNSVMEAQELRMIQDILNPPGDRGSGVPSEVMALMVQNQQSATAMVTALMESISKNAAVGAPNPAEVQLLTYLMEEIKGLKAAGADVGPDMLDVFDRVQTNVLKWQDDAKAKVVQDQAAAPAAATTDGMVLLEAEKIRGETADRGMQFQLLMASQERNWLREDRRFELEFGARTADAKALAEVKAKRDKQFHDLASAFVKSLGAAEGEEEETRERPAERIRERPPARPTGQNTEAAEPRMPTSFNCDACQTLTRVPPDFERFNAKGELNELPCGNATAEDVDGEGKPTVGCGKLFVFELEQ